MAKLIKFPPSILCPRCGVKLRPATQAEIHQGIQSGNPTIKQAFSYAVQGDLSRKTVSDNSLPDWLDAETEEGSWVMRCDLCGLTSVYMQENSP
jgi:hypothetical protein